ncbi:Rrf2 family transcriptional regulator [Solitalea sp. MAHUQ-68]|uniref:Rrf2 family transcriptional regulator n=1 Tax=Solitalea agri TaxID=2953739 RepID=A0A9X2F4D4_9SPHI|nr:Rrf2 family transcriptional regulator [Solitalea agri]MCO4293945.1 Rrf2 family transcriptional regulator [Solitalea agri]
MLSKTCEYAIRALIYIVYKSGDGNKLGIKDIAKEIGSPEHFTAKILQTLSRQGIISSTKGPNGGFYVEKDTAPIPIINVMIAIDGPKPLGTCVLGLKECNDLQPCPLHDSYKGIKQSLFTLFSTKTIQDLAADVADGKVIKFTLETN